MLARAMNIVYSTDPVGVEAGNLEGFFADWPLRPSPERHLEILRGSDKVVLAREGDGRVVGFVTAISDGALVTVELQKVGDLDGDRSDEEQQEERAGDDD